MKFEILGFDSINMVTFVLVHGTGHGGWCWRLVNEKNDFKQAERKKLEFDKQIKPVRDELDSIYEVMSDLVIKYKILISDLEKSQN